MRLTFQLQQSILGGGNENSKDNLFPKLLSSPFPLTCSKESQPLLHRVVNSGFLTSSGCQQSHKDVTSSLGAHAEHDEGPSMSELPVERHGQVQMAEMVQGAREGGDSIFLSLME